MSERYDSENNVCVTFLGMLTLLADYKFSVCPQDPEGTEHRRRLLHKLLNTARKKEPDAVKRFEAICRPDADTKEVKALIQKIHAAIGNDLGMQIIRGDTVH